MGGGGGWVLYRLYVDVRVGLELGPGGIYSRRLITNTNLFNDE